MADISKLVLEVDSSGVVKAKDNLDKMNKSSNESEKATGKLSKGFLKASVAVGALATALKGAIKFAKESLKAFADFESVKTNLQIVTGSAEEAERQFNSLKTLAASTPFEIAGLTNASIALQQVGVDAENVESIIRMLGDAAGGNNELFNRISQNYAQILSVGKASAMDIKQFAQMGLPVYQLIKDMGIQGDITADHVTEMFRRMTSEGGTFFNGMSLQSETLNGKISTLGDTWKSFLADFAESSGLSDLAKSVIDDLTERIQHLVDEIGRAQKAKALVQGFNEGGYSGQIAYYDELISQKSDLLKGAGLNLSSLRGGTKDAEKLKEMYGLLGQDVKAYLDALDERERLIKAQNAVMKTENENRETEEDIKAKNKEQEKTNDIIQERLNLFRDLEPTLISSEEERIKKQIEELNKLLTDSYTEFYAEVDSLGKKHKTSRSTGVLSDDEKLKVKELIADLTKQLEELNDNVEEEKSEEDIEAGYKHFEELFSKMPPLYKGETDSGIDTEMLKETFSIFEKVFGPLWDFITSIEGVNQVLHPLVQFLRPLTPAIKAMLVPLAQLSYGLGWLGEKIMKLLDWMTGGKILEAANEFDRLTGNTENVNENLESTVKSLQQLQAEIDKQSIYYKKEKLGLNAQNRYSVNDMILTPQGVFSTHPKDTIIATKNPQDLVSGSRSVNIEINNSYANGAEVTAHEDNMGKIIIEVSKKVANDYASGANGWDNAVNYRTSKNRGRRLS